MRLTAISQVVTVLNYVQQTHPLSGGGTFRNEPSTAADLNETSLENALIDISTFVDERNMIVAMRGTKLIIPPQLQFVADRLLNDYGELVHQTMIST